MLSAAQLRSFVGKADYQFVTYGRQSRQVKSRAVTGCAYRTADRK
jgi:hypothetical protein